MYHNNKLNQYKYYIYDLFVRINLWTDSWVMFMSYEVASTNWWDMSYVHEMSRIVCEQHLSITNWT